jgi:hypothetical protein
MTNLCKEIEYVCYVYQPSKNLFLLLTINKTMWMSSNELKLMSKGQLFSNSCYICLRDATLIACESWKVVLIE